MGTVEPAHEPGSRSVERLEISADVLAVLDAIRTRGLGIRLDGDHAVIDVDGHHVRRRWAWLPKNAPAPPLGHVLDHYAPDTLLLADRMPAARAAQARVRGLWYADAVGHMYFRGEGVLVDVTPTPGRRAGAGAGGAGTSADLGNASTSMPGMARPSSASNLFSPARAQVVFAVLAWPDLLARPVRALAQVSGTSTGHTQGVLATLEADGYLTAGRHRLLRAGDLLERFGGAFGRGLGRRLQLATFTGTPDPSAWADAPYRVYVSGDAATEYVRGPGLVLYVPALDHQRILTSRWRTPDRDTARRAGAGLVHADGTIILRRQFWQDPTTQRSGMPASSGVATAPWPLVYADLVTSADSRSLHAAAEVAGEHGLHQG